MRTTDKVQNNRISSKLKNVNHNVIMPAITKEQEINCCEKVHITQTKGFEETVKTLHTRF